MMEDKTKYTKSNKANNQQCSLPKNVLLHKCFPIYLCTDFYIYIQFLSLSLTLQLKILATCVHVLNVVHAEFTYVCVLCVYPCVLFTY